MVPAKIVLFLLYHGKINWNQIRIISSCFEDTVFHSNGKKYFTHIQLLYSTCKMLSSNFDFIAVKIQVAVCVDAISITLQYRNNYTNIERIYSSRINAIQWSHLQFCMCIVAISHNFNTNKKKCATFLTTTCCHAFNRILDGNFCIGGGKLRISIKSNLKENCKNSSTFRYLRGNYFSKDR